MDEKERLRLVTQMMVGCQIARSIMFENLGIPKETDEWLATSEGRVYKDLNPWLIGDGCIIPTLANIIERGTIDGPTFYNIMWVANTFELKAVLDIYFIVTEQEPLPEPNFEWMISE